MPSGSGNTGPPEALAARGAEALRQDRFREAVELFKQAVRVEPRPDWKDSLADAYRGRANDLAGKGMFEEAAIVLENTIALSGAVRDSNLYITCLFHDGQHQKAAAHLFNHQGADQGEIDALAAALLVSVPELPDLAPGATAEQTRRRDLALAARAALTAWCGGAPAGDIDRLLNGISLRSAFRPLRLLLKTLITPPEDAGHIRKVLDSIPPESPFFPLRQAVAAAVLPAGSLDADTWNRLTPGQQTFVAETSGVAPSSTQFLTRLTEAERGGPGLLFNFLVKQTDPPRAEIRNACVNLLPQVPDRLSQFEKTFGELTPLETRRIRALAAEARADWGEAGRYWDATADAIIERGAAPDSRLALGVIYRHVARLATKHGAVRPDSLFDNPAVSYLKRACEADPEYLPSRLDLIGHYRKDPGASKDWHQAVDEAVKRFPDDARVLQQALDSALARKAFKQASGFARRLLKINAINPGVRRQMIELQISYARKQMRAKRPDLAMKGLGEAAEWERPDAPSAALRITRGLVERRTASAEQGEATVREGVALMGGGVPGWFRARLEADLTRRPGEIGWLHKELALAWETPPSAEAILAVVSALNQPDVGETKRAVDTLVLTMRPWLEQGAGIDWKPAEFLTVAEMLAKFREFGLLRRYAQTARRRDAGSLEGQFYDIVGRTQGDADRMSMTEEGTIDSLIEAAARRQDFHMVSRINRYLEGEGIRRREGYWGPAEEETEEELNEEELLMMFRMMVSGMPKDVTSGLRRKVNEIGREQTLKELIAQMKFSPIGPMADKMLRDLCDSMIERALDGKPPKRGAARHGSLF